MPSSSKQRSGIQAGDEVGHPDAVAGYEKTALTRSIPSLDGLRALSVALVILSHVGPLELVSQTMKVYLFLLGQLGVSMFFVISGFLITFLLCKEVHETSTISLQHFYARRAFRIFPAFYVYIAVNVVLAIFGRVDARSEDFWFASLYLWNFYMTRNTGAVLGHTWTLALEEQFYLIWPMALKILKQRRATYLAAGLIILEPFIRILAYLLFPSLRQTGKVAAMLPTRIDTLMFGCLIALVWKTPHFKQLTSRYLRASLFYPTAFFLVVLNPLLNMWFRHIYHPVWMTTEGAALSIVLTYAVLRPRSFAGWLLNLSPLRFLGRISYSLYLWQQLCNVLWPHRFPLNVLMSLGCAVGSYYLVEKPALRLRDQWLSPLAPAAS